MYSSVFRRNSYVSINENGWNALQNFGRQYLRSIDNYYLGSEFAQQPNSFLIVFRVKIVDYNMLRY